MSRPRGEEKAVLGEMLYALGQVWMVVVLHFELKMTVLGVVAEHWALQGGGLG